MLAFMATASVEDAPNEEQANFIQDLTIKLKVPGGGWDRGERQEGGDG
jgi:hypothetical protein